MMKPLLLLITILFSVYGEKINIAVLDFDAIGISEQNVTILSNKFRSDLVNGGHVTIVDRGEMNTILKEQEFQQTGCTSQECAVEVGQVLGVSHMVTGSISLMSDLYYINAKLINVESGVIEKSVDEYINEDITKVLTSGMPTVAANLFNKNPQKSVTSINSVDESTTAVSESTIASVETVSESTESEPSTSESAAITTSSSS